MDIPRLVIAGTQSGVGKTTITAGLLAAFRARGLQVQPFKVGPDYIDPTYHRLAAGRECRNLDSWLIPPEQIAPLFGRACADADLAIIEGVMGLFDGFDYDDETGSTAQAAKLINAPVLIVLDAGKQARSAAALARGFQQFDPGLMPAGFIINRVGSAGHGQGVARVIEKETGLPVLGYVPRDEQLQVPERHLGLVPTQEPGRWQAFIDAARASVEHHLDIDQLLLLASGGRKPPDPESKEKAVSHDQQQSKSPTSSAPLIAVARDEAFHFTYPDNLELLEAAGARLAFFSPLRDRELPAGTAGVVLSGGFPEVHAAALAGNESMYAELRTLFERSVPIYAECGGLMYLTQAIVDLDGKEHRMVGLLPGRSRMASRVTLGYRLARAASSSWLFQKEETIRGHEFHYSLWEDRPADLPPAYELVAPRGGQETRVEGARLGSLFASYVHLHFAAMPTLAERFVTAARGAGL